jgi:hypothetical protein
MANDINYKSYPSYGPYKSYSLYPFAVEEAAAKMDMTKRHEMMMGMGMKKGGDTMRDDAR